MSSVSQIDLLKKEIAMEVSQKYECYKKIASLTEELSKAKVEIKNLRNEQLNPRPAQ